LGLLQNVLKELGSDVHLYVDEDVEIDEDEVVEGTLVVIQGDAEIDGTVDGDVVVVDGTLQLLSEGRILGDVRLADADIEYDGGTVEGSVVDLLEGERDLEAELREELREELRHELTSEIRRTVRREDRGGFNPFGGLFRGIGGLIQNAFSILILGLIGMGVVAFAGENLDAVAETARRNPGRAAAVGVAGTFLLIPVWVLGAVALAVSIVGIPVMIAWLPLFPLAAVAAGLLGYLAVARNVGEWLADSGYRYTDWIRKSSPVYLVFGGLVGLTAFFIAANVLSVVPFVGFLRGILTFAGMLVTVAAALVGFGAVLLTRAGRRREYYPADFDEAWDRAMDAEIELDEDMKAADSDPSDGNGTNEGNDDA
jgi:cytoskeletal protein CcmA (bactofilin family)